MVDNYDKMKFSGPVCRKHHVHVVDAEIAEKSFNILF